MKKHSHFLLILLALLMIAGMTVVSGRRIEGQGTPTKNQRRTIDESRFPIAEFGAPEPTDPVQRSKRQARGRKHDKSDWGVNPDAISDSTVRVDFVDRNLPAFPLAQSKTVVIGEITDARAYLSNDKTGVYSVFAVRVYEILKNTSFVSFSPGSSIEVEREGGRVKFPSGRVHFYITTEQDMPRVGSRYVLFLTDGDNEPVFTIMTGYELDAGKVRPLDDLPRLKAYEDREETNFLTELRAKIIDP